MIDMRKLIRSLVEMSLEQSNDSGNNVEVDGEEIKKKGIKL